MPHIRAWLKENPEKAKEYMNKNPRYIFFKLSPEGDGPMGALGVPLTPKRSLAVDTRFIPLGTPLYLDTTDPDGNKVQLRNNRSIVIETAGIYTLEYTANNKKIDNVTVNVR